MTAVHTPTHWGRWRRATQVTVALFYLALPLLSVVEFHHVAGTLAALKLGPLDLVEPAAGISGALAARRIGVTLAVGMLPVVVFALSLGPVFCSWICPWGFLSEGVDALRQKVFGKPWKDESWVRARRARGWTFAAIAIPGAIAGIPLAALISAPRLITTLPLELIFLKVVSPVTGGLLLALLLLEVVGPRRFWCRIGCPVGALASWLRTPRTLTIRYEPSTCICHTPAMCHEDCAWGIDPRKKSTFDGCTNCMKCVEGCPSRSLTPGFGVAKPRALLI